MRILKKLKSFLLTIKTFIIVKLPSFLSGVNLEEKKLVINITNGSDEVVGTGVGYEEGEITPRWASGGIDHSHQFFVAAGIVILEKDKKITHFYSTGAASTMMEYADMPDKDDISTAFASHFWDPDTNKNFLGLSSPTGKTRFIENYNAAVNSYASDKQQAYQYLGRALHYLSDIGQPHHASNQIAGLTNHSAFEKWVDERRTDFLISTSDKYSICANNSIATIFTQVAVYSKLYKDTVNNSNNWSIVAKETMANTQRYIAGVLYRFLIDVDVI